MTYDDLLLVAVGSHAAVFVGALAAYYKFGDRTDVTSKSLQGTDNVLRDMRRAIAAELADWLRPALEESITVSTLIVDPSSASYIERPSRSLDSERFREAVKDFVEVDSGRLADCRTLLTLRKTWCSAAAALSWLLLCLLIWQGAVSAALAFLGRTEVIHFPAGLILWSPGPTVLLAVGVAVCLVVMQVSHDRITALRMRYGSL